jgi:hypothetical protein
MGGISYSVWLRDLCAGFSWYRLLCYPADCLCMICICTQLGCTTDGTTTIRHIGHVTAHYMIYHPFDLYFK